MTMPALSLARRRLRSGLLLVAARQPNSPVFAAVADLDVSRLDERPEEAGIGSLLAALLDEGTARRSGEDLAIAVEALGASLWGGSAGGGVKCPLASAPKAVKLLAEMIREPAFAPADVRRVRGELIADRLAEREEPRIVAHERFAAEVYGAHPYGRASGGEPERLAALGARELRRHHRRFFVPANGIVAAVSADDPERTLDLLERAFRPLDGVAPAHPPLPTVELPPRPRDVHVPMDREQLHLFVGHVGVRRTHPDLLALRVLDHVLGTGPGFTSRITKKLRDDQGLCYSCSAGISGSADLEPGCFVGYIGTRAEHREKALAGILEEVRRLQREPVTAAELEDVHRYLTGSFVFGFERAAGLARLLVAVERFGLGDDYLPTYTDRIRAVGVEDVQRAAQAHLHPDHMVAVSAGAPLARAGREAKAVGAR